jgi:hypothetical protein
MRGLIINDPVLLKWNSAQDVNSVTALLTVRHAYLPTSTYAGSKATACLKAIAHVSPNLLNQTLLRNIPENSDLHNRFCFLIVIFPSYKISTFIFYIRYSVVNISN